jgi:WD40 repeat protein
MPSDHARSWRYLAIFGLWLGLGGSAARPEDAPTYERDIRPILSRRCTICHSTKRIDDPQRSGGLALDSFEALTRGTVRHEVVVSGQATESELYRRLTTEDEERRMPLDDEPLGSSERELVRRWIDAGLPRGEPPGRTASLAATATRTPIRFIDVALAVPVNVPKGRLLDTREGPLEIVVKLGPLPPVTALAFRDDGRLLAVGTDRRVMLWDLAEARALPTLADLEGPVHSLAFSRDGRRLAVGAGLAGRSGTARVYSVPDGTILADFAGHTDIVSAVAFRPDGAQLATASFDQTVRLWDLVNPREQGIFEGHSDFVHDLAYSRDGKVLYTCGKDRSIKQIDTTTCKGIRTYSGHDDEVLAIAVRGDGSGFVSAGIEPALCWWAPDGEKPSRRQRGHGGAVHCLAFSRDGRRLISASADKTVRTWDGATGAAFKTLSGATEWQYAAALSADGALAAAGGWDGIVRLWDVETAKLRASMIQPPNLQGSGCEWLVVGSNGAFNASPGLGDLIRVRVGGTEAPREAAMARLHHPSSVAGCLRGEATEDPLRP